MGRFGDLIFRLRQENNYSQHHVATTIGTYKGYISGIERGLVKPPSSHLVRKLARLFKLPEKDLLITAMLEKVPEEVRRDLEHALCISVSDNRRTGSTVAIRSVPLLNSGKVPYPSRVDDRGELIPQTPHRITLPYSHLPRSIQYALVVADDQMASPRLPSFEPGDLAFLSSGVPLHDHDIAYIVTREARRSGAQLREVLFRPRGTILLRTWNKKYRDESIAWKDVRLLFKVAAHIEAVRPAQHKFAAIS